MRLLTHGEDGPADGYILLAQRRFDTTLVDAATLVGVPIRPNTFGRLIQYSDLLDVHLAFKAPAKRRSHEKAEAASNHPDMYHFYVTERVGE